MTATDICHALEYLSFTDGYGLIGSITACAISSCGPHGSGEGPKSAMTDPDLIRFLDAQDQIYAQVIEEL